MLCTIIFGHIISCHIICCLAPVERTIHQRTCYLRKHADGSKELIPMPTPIPIPMPMPVPIYLYTYAYT